MVISTLDAVASFLSKIKDVGDKNGLMSVVGKGSWENRVVGKFLVGKIDSKLERTV